MSKYIFKLFMQYLECGQRGSHGHNAQKLVVLENA